MTTDGHTSPKRSRDLTADRALRRGRIVWIIAAIVSLGAHAVAAWTLHNRPVGRFDLRLSADRSTPLPVRLAVEEPWENPPLEPESGGDARPVPLQALGEELLNPRSPAPRAEAAAIELANPLRDERGDAGQVPIDLPETAMSPAVQRKLIGNLSVGVAFVPESDDDGGTFGERSDAPDGAGAAERLLADSGLQPVANPQPAPMRPPSLVESGVLERGTLEAPLAPAPIDFADLALRGTTQHEVPRHLDSDFDYAIRAYRPRKGPAYFRIDVTGRRSLTKLSAMPKDVVFLVDTSGSVPEPWVKASIQGVTDALAGLNQGDRFNIVLFKETPAFFSTDTIRPYDTKGLLEAREFLNGAASSGYTDLNHALSRLLTRDVEANRVYYLVLISDGRPTRGVMDTRELINRITRDNNLAASIYCVGVGHRQNRQLLDYLAYRNKGYTVFSSNVGGAAASIRDLLSRLRYPVLKDIKIDIVGVPKDDVFPHHLPNMHQSERAQLFGRFDRETVGPITVRVRGSNHGQDFDFTFRRDLRRARDGDRRIAKDWAVQKLHHLYSDLLRADDPRPIQKQIDRLKRRHKLKTLY